MDTLIWSTWHDLDPTDEVEHVARLHGTYLPAQRTPVRRCRPVRESSKAAGTQ
jgi:hypothetical protein